MYKKEKWEVKWSDEALKGLSKLDEITEQKIRNKVKNHLASHPTQNGYPLKYKWRGFWGYHIDDYRAVYEIVYEIKEREKEITVVVVEVGERDARQTDSIYGRTPPRPSSPNRITERPQARDLKRKIGKK